MKLKVFVHIEYAFKKRWCKFEWHTLINEWVMRQTNVCLNRVFKVYVKCVGGSRNLLCSRKKCAMKIERNKQTKIKKQRALHTRWPGRWERDKELLNEDKRQRFIVGDIDSSLIEGTINVLNFRARGMGMIFRTWVYERAPLSSQCPVLKNGGADFHHC